MDIKRIIQSKDFKRFLILALICLLLFSIRSMFNIILLTLLFTVLMGSLHKVIMRQINRFFFIPPKIILSTLYILLISTLLVGIVKMIPVVNNQVVELYHLVISMDKVENELVRYFVSYLDSVEIQRYIKPGIDIVFNVSHLGLNVLLALILSLFYLLERSKVTQFTAQFKTSKLGWLFQEIDYFRHKFIHTFGKVIEVQLMIALINCIFTTLALWIMGFPYLLGLALIVFVLGLIPVAGVLISLIPLCTIAFSIGGLQYVITLLIVITILHAIEAYFLNPKLMSSKTHLPMFYTFIVLIFSEHFLGIWGLIIGIPLFVFLLDILEVKNLSEGVPSVESPLPSQSES